MKDYSMLTDRFDDAFHYTHRLHRAQTRKGTPIPYISHLMTVAALVIEHGGNEDQAIGALLHDAAEDQGGMETLEEIRRRFGDAVTEIVSDCTDAWTEPKPEWRPHKEAYLAKLPSKPEQSLLVSLADKTHNAEAILFDYRVLGDPLWQRFNGGPDGTRWYYGALANVFSRTMPGPLSDRLSRAVAAFSVKRRRWPPWGDLLGGKPIERQVWIFGDKTEWEEEFLRDEQFSRMLRLKTYHGILGGENPLPARGVAPADWLPWYELALRIASDLDESLKIADAKPPAKTAARWRGPEGLFLVRLVDSMRKNRPKTKPSVRWCLQELCKRSPGLSKMSLQQLQTRYYDAKKHFGTTKPARKQKHPS